MKKLNIILFITITFFLIGKINSQIKFSDLSFDKNGNKYLVGSFDNSIDLGNNNLISSNGGTDIFISKYDSKGICQWGTKIGGKNNDNISGIYIEPTGNFYLTGYFIGEAKFGDIKVKSPSNKIINGSTLFVAKYNTSGDPIWVKTSKNINADAGYGLTSDGKGNVFIIGMFEGQLSFDGKAVSSNGKSDICLIKINASGNSEWIKNYGGKEDNEANAIFYQKNKLVIAGSSISETVGYKGYLAELSAETGSINWEKSIGSTKADIEKISVDNNSNYIITGSLESSYKGHEGYDLFVNKLNPENGNDIWIRKFHSNQAKGKDIVCDGNGNIFVTGCFTDSLKLDAFYLSGLPFNDVFLAKLNLNGKVTWAKSYGHNNNDIGSKLLLRDNELLISGEFSTGIEFGKTTLTGGENTIFLTSFDLQKQIFNNSIILAKESQNSNENSKYSNISGKLLVGSSENKAFLNDQPVYIEDNNGNFIKRTITDENGDFSFKNIDLSVPINLILEKNENLKEADEVYLAQQNGVILHKLELDEHKNFVYKLLPFTLNKLEPLDDEKEPILVMKEFKTSKDDQFTLTERILYEANSFTIPSDAFENLNQVALFLRQNPKMKIEIFSNTDSNGDDNYNLSLSEKRANEVKLYLIKKQVPQERIMTKGLGETKILNRCGNNVKCTETEHSFNRRTEFKFIKNTGF